jgi:hypothetical protein
MCFTSKQPLTLTLKFRSGADRLKAAKEAHQAEAKEAKVNTQGQQTHINTPRH